MPVKFQLSLEKGATYTDSVINGAFYSTKKFLATNWKSFLEFLTLRGILNFLENFLLEIFEVADLTFLLKFP